MLPLSNKAIQSRAASQPATGGPTGFVENFKADFAVARNEAQLISEQRVFDEIFSEQAKALREAGFADRISDGKKARTGPQLDAELRRVNQENDLELPTADVLLNGIVKRYGVDRQTRDDIAARATGGGKFGSFAGGTAGILSDPIVAISSVWGASASSGILRTMLIEAGIASGIETAIQPQIYSFKKAIDSPYSVGEAVLNIASAGAGAAGIAGILKTLAKAPAGGRALLDAYRKQKADGTLSRKPGTLENTAEDFLERHIDESDANPFERENPDSAVAHGENLQKAVNRIDNGEPIQPDDLREPVPRETKGERRADLTERKRVADMTPEERAKVLLSDDLTPLGNRRAFNEFIDDNPDHYVLFGDLDDFKEINTSYGHDEVDIKIFPLVGEIKQQVAKELGIPITVRRTGDEFLSAAPSEKKLQQYGERVQKKLQNAIVEMERLDGTIVKHKGIGYSFGVGKNERLAEIKTNQQKASRKAAGLRTGARDTGTGAEPATTGNKNKKGLSARLSRRNEKNYRPVEEYAERMDADPAAFDEIMDAETARIIDENPDLAIPTDEKIDATGNRVAATSTARELLQQAEDDKIAADIFTECATGAVEAAV